MNINNFYIVCNKLQPHEYNFYPLLLDVNMSDADYIKFCQNIYRYVKKTLIKNENSYLINDITLNTLYENCFNVSNIKERIPFFVWGKSVIDRIDKDILDTFNNLNNSLFLDDETHNISNPYIINEILSEYFKTGTVLYKTINKKLPTLILNKYNFGNQEINNSYNREFVFLYDKASKEYTVQVENINVFESDILENLPQINTVQISNDKIKFHVYAVCYNESRLLPHFLRHYHEAESIFLVDNYSTDNTLQIVKNFPNTHIIKFNTNKSFNDTVHKYIKNNIWKLSRGKVDYVIVQDLDEFLFFPECNSLSDGILKLKSVNTPYVISQGYNICFNDKDYEAIIDNNLSSGRWSSIIDHTVKGYKNYRYDKCLIFNPDIIQEINYGEGSHEISPKGDFVNSDNSVETILLHYKHIGEQYEMKRKMYFRDRMSKDNFIRGFGSEYFRSDRDIIFEVKMIHKKTGNIYDLIHKKPKLTCTIMGGLGNQLFMVAATLAHAWRNNMYPVFRRKMELSHNPEGYWKDIFRALPYNEDLDISNFINIKENDTQKYENILTNYQDTLITGYYQSVKYFEEYETIIRSMFSYFYIKEVPDRKQTFHELINNTHKHIRDKYLGSKLVGIFIRRGDFVYNDRYLGKWLLPLEYYTSAIENFKNDPAYKDCNFVVFSNDVDWCKEQFPDFHVYNSEFDVVQFFILSKMDGWILANSSFSWWAEFMGNPDHTKKVISPYPWIKNHNYNPQIYRDYWEKIQW